MIYNIDLSLACGDIEKDKGADNDYIAEIIAGVAMDAVRKSLEDRNVTILNCAYEFTVRKSVKPLGE